MGAPPVPEATPAVPIRDSRGADSQYSAVLMRANTHCREASRLQKESRRVQERKASLFGKDGDVGKRANKRLLKHRKM